MVQSYPWSSIQIFFALPFWAVWFLWCEFLFFETVVQIQKTESQKWDIGIRRCDRWVKPLLWVWVCGGEVYGRHLDLWAHVLVGVFPDPNLWSSCQSGWWVRERRVGKRPLISPWVAFIIHEIDWRRNFQMMDEVQNWSLAGFSESLPEAAFIRISPFLVGHALQVQRFFF